MGVVWAATHRLTRKQVALKLMRAGAPRELRHRFLQEAKAASLIDHPNVVDIHDAFELDDGAPLIVMDLLQGETLGDRLRREHSLSLAAAAEILLPVVSAVGAAHERGVVHRDLKPDNIFITKGDGVRVLDFGVAKLTDPAPGDVMATHTGVMLGTPCYMAPEQSSGEKDVDHQADVWSVGVILYEALSGGRPIEGDNVGQVLKRLMSDGIAPLSALVPDLPNDVVDVVGRMLVRERSERVRDLREVFDLLEQHAGARAPRFGAPGSRRLPPLEDATPAPALEAPTAQETAAPQTLDSPSRSTRNALILGFVLLAAAGIVGWRLVAQPGMSEASAHDLHGTRAAAGASAGLAAVPAGRAEGTVAPALMAAGSAPSAMAESSATAAPTAPRVAPQRQPETTTSARARPAASAATSPSASSPSAAHPATVPSSAPAAPRPAAAPANEPEGLVDEPPF